MQVTSATSSSTGPLSWSSPRPAFSPGTALSSMQSPHGTSLTPSGSTALRQRPEPVPRMTTSDRNAVAGATGVYLAPTGETAPAAVTPAWNTISRYLDQRHQASTAAAAAAAYNVPLSQGVNRIDTRA